MLQASQNLKANPEAEIETDREAITIQVEGKGQGATVEEQEVTKDQEVEEDHACPGAEVAHQKEMEMMMDTASILQVSFINFTKVFSH